MRYLLFVIVFISIAGCDTPGNTPDPINSYFIRYYGTEGNQEGVDMIANEDGTFMLLGTSTLSNSDKQVYLIKVDARGDVLWEKFYGGPDDETAMDIESINGGGYVLLANARNPVSGNDIQIITIDQNGEIINSGSFSYPGISNELGVTVTPIVDVTSIAGFIVAGSTDYDPIPGDNGADGYEGVSALFARFASDCTFYQGVWTESRSSMGDDYCTKVVQIGGLNSRYPFILFGYTSSGANNPSLNYWTTGMNNYGGDLLLEEGIIQGSPINTGEMLTSVSVKESSADYKNYLLAGVSIGNSSDNIFIATSQLSLISPKIVEGINLGDISAAENSLIYKVTAYQGNSGYLIGANSVLSGNSDIIITKLSADGTTLWDKPIVLGGAGDDYESAVYEMVDGRIIVFGTMSIGRDEQKKMALIKLDKNGEFK